MFNEDALNRARKLVESLPPINVPIGFGMNTTTLESLKANAAPSRLDHLGVGVTLDGIAIHVFPWKPEDDVEIYYTEADVVQAYVRHSSPSICLDFPAMDKSEGIR